MNNNICTECREVVATETSECECTGYSELDELHGDDCRCIFHA